MARLSIGAGQAQILKPESGFEALYQGLLAEDFGTAGSIPIPFFEWIDRKPPDPFDPFAGKTGYDPNLMRFLPCPLDVPVQLLIPIIAGSDGQLRRYRYRVKWRLQSLARYNDESKAGIGNQYHIPYDAPGAPDTTAPPGAQRRNIMPCATETTAASILVLDPATGFPPIAFAASTFYGEDTIIIDIGQTNQPIIKGQRPLPVRGVYQQGIVDPSVVTSEYPFIPVFALVELMTRGDQMMIVADRLGIEKPAGEPTTWDFADWDEGFSLLYGNDSLGPHPHKPFPDVGIYVLFQQTPRPPAIQRFGPFPVSPPAPPPPPVP